MIADIESIRDLPISQLHFEPFIFQRSPEDKSYLEIPAVGVASSMSNRDLSIARRSLEDYDQRFPDPNASVNISMNKIFPIKTGDDLPTGTRIFMANEATAVIKPLLANAKASIGLYQAIIQLTPQTQDAWKGTCLAKRPQIIEKVVGSRQGLTNDEGMTPPGLRIPVAKHLGLDRLDRDPETPGRLISLDHDTWQIDYLVLTYSPDSTAANYDSEEDNSRIYDYDSDFGEGESHPELLIDGVAKLAEFTDDCGADSPISCGGLPLSNGQGHFHDFELVVDFLGAKAVNEAITEALKPDANHQIVDRGSPSRATPQKSMSEETSRKDKLGEDNTEKRPRGIIKLNRGKTDSSASPSSKPLTTAQDPRSVGATHVPIPRPTYPVLQPRVRFSSPVSTSPIHIPTSPRSTPVDAVYHPSGPETLLPRGFYEHFCKLTGLPIAMRVQDPDLWKRIVHLFLLRFAEEICDEYGRMGWLERQHVPFSSDDEELLQQHLRLFHVEPTTEFRRNVYLHPLERLSARQCLEFLSYRHTSTGPDSDLNHILTIVCELLNFRVGDYKKARLINDRRIQGDFGRAGSYPRIFEDRYGVIEESMADEFRKLFYDSDDDMDSYDSY